MLLAIKLLPKVSGTKNGGTVPHKAILGVRFFFHFSRIHRAYMGFSTSILGT